VVGGPVRLVLVDLDAAFGEGYFGVLGQIAAVPVGLVTGVEDRGPGDMQLAAGVERGYPRFPEVVGPDLVVVLVDVGHVVGGGQRSDDRQGLAAQPPDRG